MAGFGQAGEDVRVGVGVEAFDDLGLEFAFLSSDGLDGAQQRGHADGVSVCLGRGQSCGGGVVDPGEEFLDGFAAAVGDPAQERREPGLGQPGGRVLGGVAAQERDRDVAVQAGEQADRAGETAFQLGLELVDQPDSSLDQLLAGPGQGTQHLGGVAVLGERGKSVSVGAQHVGEQVGVPGVGLRPGAGVAAAQPLDLPRGDHHHPQAGVEQRLDQWAVAAFDRRPRARRVWSAA